MEITRKLEELKKALKIIESESRMKELENQIQSQDFWKRSDQVEVLKEHKELKSIQEKVLALEIALSENSNSEETLKLFEELESLTYFNKKHDREDIFFSIHSGSGGVESMDFAQMLERMYLRFFDKRNFKYELLDKSYGEEAGIKSANYSVKGDYCYGFLKHEAGTHRLIRLSPFNANNLRQTSFAKVEVIPQIKKDTFVLKNSDLDITTMHSGGKGGQNVNKVETGVRIKYLPKNIVVSCTTSRSQAYNKELALQLIYSKINELIERENQNDISTLKGENIVASFGSQIRTYVLHPYSQVKDHRSEITIQNAQSVLDGNIDDFIDGNIRVLK